MSNAKNQILEWLQSLGWPKHSLSSVRHTAVPPHRVTATLSVPPLDLLLVAEAEAPDKTRADVAACEIILAELRAGHAELFVDPDSLYSDAQAGDALIKLAIYGWDAPLSPSQRTSILQRVESDRSLAGRLDEFAGDGDWSRKFGPGVGEKVRATIVEAALWRRFRGAFHAGEVRRVLPEVRSVLGVKDVAAGVGPPAAGDK